MFYSCYWNTPPSTLCYRITEDEVKSWQCYIKPLTTPRGFILEREHRKEGTAQLTALIMSSGFGLHDKLHCVRCCCISCLSLKLAHIKSSINATGTPENLMTEAKLSQVSKLTAWKSEGPFREILKVHAQKDFPPEIKYTYRKDSKT